MKRAIVLLVMTGIVEIPLFGAELRRTDSAGTTPNPSVESSAENPESLTAYYWETADGFSKHIGLGESLRRAGFHAEPLPLDRPPFDFADDPESDVDLIIFGSFVSQDSSYFEYLDTYGDQLADYVDRAGFLVQLTQADQTEASPSFLPDMHDATRIDSDFPQAKILAPEHPMIHGLPIVGDGVTFRQPHIPNFADVVVWEAFSSFAGFEVILAGDSRGRYPALMEGAYGEGRLMLAAMNPDKILDASTRVEQSDESFAQFNEMFFTNLYAHTVNVRDGTAPAIQVTPQPGVSEIPEGAWTIAILPDTQVYSQHRPGVFSAQTIWLRDNIRRYNIRYLLHVGDLVNNNSQPEWLAAREAMGVVDGYIPYSFVPGNHDYGPSGNASTRETLMNDYFHFDQYKDRIHFGGAMTDGKMDNTFHTFQAGGYDWLVMCLEWGPRDSTIDWADSILEQYPDHKTILLTHAYMNNNDYRYDRSDPEGRPQKYNPHNYSTPGGVNDGEELWQKLVRKHNFVLTLNGHVLGDGTGFRTDANDVGQNVHQMLVNYQFLSPFGGNGYLRLLVVNPDGRVDVKSYSPLYNNFLSDPDQEFSFDFEWYSPDDSNGSGVPDYYDEALDSDEDGINNHQEYDVLGTNPYGSDSDGDGIPDQLELKIGTDPTVNDSATARAILENAAEFELYSMDEIADLNVGRITLKGDDGQINVKLQLEMTEELGVQPFAPVGDPLEWVLAIPGEKAFLRVRAE